MKRTILLTMLALSLTLGASSVYAGSCSSCGRRVSSAVVLSPWKQVMLILSTIPLVY
jgi:hypothetical protein